MGKAGNDDVQNTSVIGGLGKAWIGLCFALAIHVTDEALTGFLPIYNATVLALRKKLGFFPVPTFTFSVWLIVLILGILLLLALSPLVFRNARWMRPVVYFCAIVLGVMNAMGHTMETIVGHTVSTVTFNRPAPGFYSSPLLMIAACNLLVQLWHTRASAG